MNLLREIKMQEMVCRDMANKKINEKTKMSQGAGIAFGIIADRLRDIIETVERWGEI